jgi:ATP-dependent DNA ligase
MPLVLMLATLTDRRDFGEDWLLERKFDGERCVARKDGSEVRLESRTAKDLTGTYPEVRAAVASQRNRKDGRLRQPRFLGLRDDKRPGEVVRERAR